MYVIIMLRSSLDRDSHVVRCVQSTAVPPSSDTIWLFCLVTRSARLSPGNSSRHQTPHAALSLPTDS